MSCSDDAVHEQQQLDKYVSSLESVLAKCEAINEVSFIKALLFCTARRLSQHYRDHPDEVKREAIKVASSYFISVAEIVVRVEDSEASRH